MDLAAAWTAIKARLEANYTAAALRWPDTLAPLADPPAAFAFVEVLTDAARVIAQGGGIGANTFRTDAQVRASVMAPIGTPTGDLLQLGEDLAVVLRGARFAGVRFGGAEVYPGSVTSEDGMYRGVTVIADFHFHVTG